MVSTNNYQSCILWITDVTHIIYSIYCMLLCNAEGEYSIFGFGSLYRDFVSDLHKPSWKGMAVCRFLAFVRFSGAYLPQKIPKDIKRWKLCEWRAVGCAFRFPIATSSRINAKWRLAICNGEHPSFEARQHNRIEIASFRLSFSQHQYNTHRDRQPDKAIYLVIEKKVSKNA